MKLLEKYETRAQEYGWEFEATPTDDGVAIRVWNDEFFGTGYPHLMTGIIVGGSKLEQGRIFISYGSKTEEHKVSQRYHLDVMANHEHPIRYKVFYDAFLATNPMERSEKVMAARASSEAFPISERQVRKARICGFTDDYTMDQLCCKLLSRHPGEIYGYLKWEHGVDISEVERVEV